MDILDSLDYNKVLDVLADFCVTDSGKSVALELHPVFTSCDVSWLLLETYQAVSLLCRLSSPPFSDFANIEEHLKILEANGTLSIKFILDLTKIFEISKELKSYFDKNFIDASDFSTLFRLFEGLYYNENVISIVRKSIVDNETIEDKASSSLSSIRRNQRRIEQNIKDKLNQIIHGSSFSKYIQEHIITIRNDRYVIPVKEEYRSYVKGFIHDVSNGGSTLFIEPNSVFDMNNELNNLKIEEELEIERILKNLSSLFYSYVTELRLDVSTIAKLDFIFAKAKFSNSINGITPKINDKKEINLIDARHPLIDSKKVVPISINLGIDFNVLVITGPNTGGKTVALKTVGLLELMACSGLNIPAKEHSSIYVFDNIFADIGDNQSIADSLSTFSSHMLNLVEITSNITKNSLVLVDELGSGTDPIEGASLAISILDYLNQKNCLIIATTHYQELKKYALVTNNFKNASVEFDIETLSPTYKLLVGVPGKSNAFSISKKLGLANTIIENAKSKLSSENIAFEELLKNIYDNKSKIENDKLLIEDKLKNISMLESKLKLQDDLTTKKAGEIIENSKIQARNLLLDTKDEISQLIKNANNNPTDIKDLNEVRNKLNTQIKALHSKEKIVPENINNTNSSDFKINDNVFIKSLNQYGIVISNISKNNEVQVQIGSIKTNLKIQNLKKVKKEKEPLKITFNNNYTNSSKTKFAKTELNIIGMNVEEALPIIDKFLDDCSISKIKNARIVHGKGTGKLRNGVQNYLKKHPHVTSYRIGTFGEGELGVTIVEIK